MLQELAKAAKHSLEKPLFPAPPGSVTYTAHKASESPQRATESEASEEGNAQQAAIHQELVGCFSDTLSDQSHADGGHQPDGVAATVAAGGRTSPTSGSGTPAREPPANGVATIVALSVAADGSVPSYCYTAC